MATISRFSAVVSVGKLRFSGFIGWLMWLVLHLVYIIGFKNRVTTLLHWFVSFIGRGRSERTVTEQQVVARHALNAVGADFNPFDHRRLGPSTPPDVALATKPEQSTSASR